MDCTAALSQLHRVVLEPGGRDHQASHPDPSLRQQKIPTPTRSAAKDSGPQGGSRSILYSQEIRTGEVNITQLTADLDIIGDNKSIVNEAD
jgi:hypothetical protein